MKAVISDMDGVLTRTATLHERAWQRLFDDLWQGVVGQGFSGQRPFTSADYRAHVDGKPRDQGLRDFLRSRDFELPSGEPDDGPEVFSIQGLGRRKNQYFHELLQREGAEVFDDVVAALERWRRGGLKLAAISASRNGRQVLAASGLTHFFEVIVDGQTAIERALGGKAEIMREAAQQLGVAPADAVILEDAVVGVRAGKQMGFGRVVGVARGGGRRDLIEAGADEVVEDLARLRLPREPGS